MIPDTTRPEREGLGALAERCEQAGGADREIDAAIWFAAHCEPIPAAGVVVLPGRNPVRPGDFGYRFMRNGVPEDGTLAPTYTASLDAAMSLAPEGWRLAQLAEWIGWVMREKGPWRVALTSLTPSRRRIEIEHAATPALALCAAALRARALSHDKDQA